MIAYKTAEVAEKLAVSTKALTRVAKQLDIQKNEHGHYTYTDADIKKIHEYIASQKTPDSVKTLDISTIVSPLQSQLNSLDSRLKNTESALRGKADDVVAVQLLQHRQELEELNERVTNIEHKLAKMEDQLLVYESAAATFTHQVHEKKKKNIFQHIFGL